MRARGSGVRLGLLGLLAAAFVTPGCATLGGARGGGAPRADAGEVRADAPPEYDVLVAQQHEVNGRMAQALAAYQRAAAKDDSSAYLHRKLAEGMVRQNRLQEALRHGSRALEIDPDDSSTRLFLGRIYRLLRNAAGAQRVLTDAAGDPIDENAAFLLYQVYFESGRWVDALRTAEWWLELKPHSLRATLAVATAYQRLDRPVEAEATLREALAREPGNLRLYDALARHLREQGDHEDELALYREVLEAHPLHHPTLVALAEAQIAAGDRDGAMATLEEIEEHYPDDLRSLVRLAFLHYEAREYAQAQKRFERVLEASPEDHEITFFLGLVRRRAGDEGGALEVFQRVPTHHKQYADARAQIVAIYERQGAYAHALTELEELLAVESSPELELYQATLQAKAGDLQGAVAHLEALLGQRPEDDELLYNLGVVYGEAKRMAEAVHYMELALEQNPDNASALNYVGYTWAEQGIRLDEAEELIQRAIELRPNDGYIVDSLGWVYYMRARPLVEGGRTEEAREYIERALRELKRADQLTGGDPVISEHLGDTYLLLDQKRHALDRFEEAIRLIPRHGEQLELIRKYEALQRELE